jgi:hypothetical protein
VPDEQVADTGSGDSLGGASAARVETAGDPVAKPRVDEGTGTVNGQGPRADEVAAEPTVTGPESSSVSPMRVDVDDRFIGALPRRRPAAGSLAMNVPVSGSLERVRLDLSVPPEAPVRSLNPTWLDAISAPPPPDVHPEGALSEAPSIADEPSIRLFPRD